MTLEQSFIDSHHRKLRLVVRLVDLSIVGGCLHLACLLTERTWNMAYTVAALVAMLAFHVAGNMTLIDRPGRVIPVSHQASRLLGTWALVVPVLLVVAFFAKVSAEFSRVTTFTWFLLAPTLLLIWRIGMRLALQELRSRGRNTHTVAIVGATSAGLRLAGEISNAPWFGLRILGFYDDRAEPETRHVGERPTNEHGRLAPIPPRFGGLCGDLDQLVRKARTGLIDTIYIALPLGAKPRIRSLIDRLTDTTASVHVVPDLMLSDLLQLGWTSVGTIPVLSVHDTPFQGINRWLKRAEDIVLGTIILSVIAIPMLIIAIAVKATSKGPAIFKQTRYGLNGKPITVFKFRTMTVDEDSRVINQATKGDPRVTKLGAFLRRTSLDELPQFLNVITGEMSIVGPRPHAIAHNEFYRRRIPGYMLRHKVKPGITGWAQVNGWRGEIRRWGVLLDLKILFLTVFGRAVWRNAH
jgi:putative colanic acid biosynthesis UDP-glucose lipid carrier transferase